ncbi:MAG TPA: hypothetical protein IAB38_03550 [Candidatus Onthousia excrementipullorum]|uniref:Uncharacterized protein n=1 Tax=Candidatus Onthousia excrementipullorum TaxID=2840884 RepID=A0A9D1DUE0_9FIRM|nr:hypothetical protein [Candidatus Onthousia excrementipullorum]
MKKKENIIIIVVLVVMILAIVGVSYAAFSYSKTGSKVNSITTGSITMTYEETDNTISLSGALPTTDKTGTVRLNPGEYFDFSVSSEITGDVNINYEISAKKEDGNTIDGRYIKLYLTRLTDDGEEEALMVPETYNEESSTNDYTGRPAEEMSLYTSSMNSSENNNYRLRMYVDESYNPQGDGGGLTFSVRINVYGKAGDKYVPLTTQEILEDNELQEEKTQMFNYASNGGYFDMSGGSQSTNPEYVTNGLYSTEDEDGTSYYYRGNVTNNNVQFGEYQSDYYVYEYSSRYFQSLESCQEYNSSCSESNKVKLASAGDKMYWKIVRVNGDGSLRLIYNGTSASPDNSDLAHSYTVGSSPYNLNADNPKYTGYTYDRDTNETDSFIKREVDTWYANALGNTEYDSKVSSGRFCSDSSGYLMDDNLGYNVFASYDRLGQSDNNFAKPNNPSLKCPSTSESYGGSYRLKAGLITADELVLAVESSSVSGNSYLNPGERDYWGMTPSAFAYNSADISVINYYDGLTLVAVNVTGGSYGVRPVININANSKFASGDGTAENPYVITAE